MNSRHAMCPRVGIGLSLTLLAGLAVPLAGARTAAIPQPDGTTPPPPLTASATTPELPPELRPLDIVRPTLPAEIAAEVAELEARIAELETLGLTAVTKEAQDAALGEAIGLAGRVLAIRIELQGNTDEVARWRNREGEPVEWLEVIDARRTLADLRLLRELKGEDRAALAALAGTDAETARLYGEGKYAEAQAVTERQLDTRRRVLGDEHPNTLAAISWMGLLLQAQGRLAEAEPYWRGAMEGNRRVLGDEHPDTLVSIGWMGSLLQAQGRVAEAEPYIRGGLEGSRRVLGDEHPNTLTSVNNMGLLLHFQGRLAEAEPYYREGLEASRRVLGDEHPYTLASINNMGGLLESQGRLAEAEPYHREALEGKRRALGDEHPDTLGSIGNMGTLLRSQGRLAEAEPYAREALEVSRRVLGNEHPSTLNTINNLGVLLISQGRLAEAEPYAREALVRRRVLGTEHPDTLLSIGNMGGLLKSQGRLAEAEPYYREALEGNRRVLGDEHPGTLLSIGDMGVLLEAQGRLAEAEPYYREALDGRRRVLGDEHPSTLLSINNMGSELSSQGRLAEAEPYYREALETAERLRIDVIGDAQARAQFAGRLNLSGIASAYVRVLVGLGRNAEAMGVLERGRGRAALDLFAGGRLAAEAALRSSADPAGVERYGTALASEDQARLALAETEARLRAAPGEQKTEWTRRVLDARRTLSERTAAVFAELRGLIPAVNPLTTEQILAGLAPGQALLSFSLTDDGAIALVARDGKVHGFTIASDRETTTALVQRLGEARTLIATRPGTPQVDAGTASEITAPHLAGPDLAASLQAARDLVLPAELRESLAGATSLTVVPDGPLTGIPMELLIEGTPITYAPSATIYLDRLRVGREIAARRDSSSTVALTAVVLGDPIFDRAAPTEPEPALPTTGALVAMVVDGGPAAAAGASRRDVLLTYDGVELPNFQALGPARAAVDAAIADGSRPADQPVSITYWRDGETLEATVPPGRLGVTLSQAPADEGLRSMRTLDQLSTPRGMEEFAANASVLDQVRLYGGALRPLPGTRTEARAIAALLPGATLLMGEDATAPKLTHAVETSSPRYLHLATHGLMGIADRPQDASLALTQPETPTPDDTGFLTLQDLLAQWGGDLKGTDLVVLSACETGRGVQSGDTLMSLPLGFFQAGTPTVIASLWKVDDTATALLMTRFYKNLLGQTESSRQIDGRTFAPGEPLPKLAALREAQAWLRDLTRDQADAALTGDGLAEPAESGSRDPERAQVRSDPGDLKPYAHPHYWAAFVLIGSPE